MPQFDQQRGYWVESVHEAAVRLDRADHAIVKLLDTGKLLGYKEGGRWHVSSASINALDASEQGGSQFSVSRAICAAMQPAVAHVLAQSVGISFSRQIEPHLDAIQQELATARSAQEVAEASQGLSRGRDFVLPWDARLTSRANIDSATSSTGGPFKFTMGGSFVDALRNKSSIMRAGISVLPNLTGPVSFPKEVTQGTAAWVAENPGSDASLSNLTTTSVTLSFKTIKGSTSFTRQALFSAASGNYDLEAVIRGDLSQVIALAIDQAGTTGLGASNQPLGVLTDTAVATLALGSNGLALAATAAAQLVKDVATNKADTDSPNAAFLSNQSVEYYGRVNPRSAGIADPMITDDNLLVGKRFIMSQQIPANLTKGTSTTICSALIFGVWEYLTLGLFGAGLDVVVDPYAGKLQNVITVDVNAYADIQNRAPAAFKKCVDILA